MAIFEISIRDKDNKVLIENKALNEVTIAYRGEYLPGDYIQLKSDTKDIYIKLRLDDSLTESIVYLSDYIFCFPIPCGDDLKPYGEKAFTGIRHWGYVSLLDKKEYNNVRNLALNTFDYNDNQIIYPHVTTNVMTDNPQFFGRNVIDGIFETSNHGSWPHSSWGINKQSDAWIKVDFKETVFVDELLIYLRADFPHDNWWQKMTVTFSDGESRILSLEKTGQSQVISVKKKTNMIVLSDLMMSNEESLFPALSQMKVIGKLDN
ncbi:hypothetical protein [Tannockella kyphosi]|uniref:hypothetical protein n=1 Tax=Tannockella kyphosi TaxID=2899121 RepID=UPI002011675E|nr:hypothetical protein [Tannockella kyphosi]